MQFRSIIAILFLAAPLVHAVALPTNNFNGKVEIRAGDTKKEAARLEKLHTEACDNYRRCRKGCATASGYLTGSEVLKEKAKKQRFEICVKKSCDKINEMADGFLRQWKTVDNAVNAKMVCAA